MKADILMSNILISNILIPNILISIRLILIILISNISISNTSIWNISISIKSTFQYQYPNIKYLLGHSTIVFHRQTLGQNWSGWTSGSPLVQLLNIGYSIITSWYQISTSWYQIFNIHILLSNIQISQADAGAELKRLDKWLAKTEEKLDGGKIVVSVTYPSKYKYQNIEISKYPKIVVSVTINPHIQIWLIHVLRKGLKHFFCSEARHWQHRWSRYEQSIYNTLRNVLKYFSIQKPDSIVDACQALSKARELRAQFEKKEKPLITAKVEIYLYRNVFLFKNYFTPPTTNNN